MKKSIKEREWKRCCVSVVMSLPRAYEDPQEPGALGGVDPFAKAQKLKTPQAQRILQSVFGYKLHKPRRTRFPTTPTLVFDRDEQWQMDLVDMQKLSRWNKGNKYLLTVIDVLSKYARAVPIKSKRSQDMIRGLESIYLRLFGSSALRPALGPKDPTPQMPSGRLCMPQQETSSLQKRLFTRTDGRSVCGHAYPSSSCGHLSTQ